MILTALCGPHASNCAVGCETGRAGHAGTLLLQTRRVCVNWALDGSGGVVSCVVGIVETLGLDCRRQKTHNAGSQDRVRHRKYVLYLQVITRIIQASKQVKRERGAHEHSAVRAACTLAISMAVLHCMIQCFCQNQERLEARSSSKHTASRMAVRNPPQALLEVERLPTVVMLAGQLSILGTELTPVAV